jgi:thiol-disulfide isomerase/thioredoxin
MTPTESSDSDVGRVAAALTDTAPIQAAALADGRTSLAELRGRPVGFNFWASWCVPREKEAPVLAQVARVHTGQVVVLGIDVDRRGRIAADDAGEVRLADLERGIATGTAAKR